MLRFIKNTDKSSFVDYFQNIRVPYKGLFLGNKNLKKVNECKKIFNHCLKNKSVCIINETNAKITGILIVYYDNGDKYLKIYGDNRQEYRNLTKFLLWNKPCNLNFKLYKYDPNFKIAVNCGFMEKDSLKDGYKLVVPKRYNKEA